MGTEWCVENLLKWCSAYSLPPGSCIVCPILFPRFSRLSIPCLGFPPADDDAAQYLFDAFASSSPDRQPRTAADFKNALEETRTKQETKELGYEDRISAALSILGVL